MTTVKAAQGVADDLVAELDRVRVEVMRAFPAEAAARMGRPVPVGISQSAGV